MEINRRLLFKNKNILKNVKTLLLVDDIYKKFVQFGVNIQTIDTE